MIFTNCRRKFEHGKKSRHLSINSLGTPRRCRAGRSTVSGNISATPDDQLWYYNFRIGEYPNFDDNVKVPHDAESVRQFFMLMTPDTGAYPSNEIISDAMVEVFKKAGEGILSTHSAGGGSG